MATAASSGLITNISASVAIAITPSITASSSPSASSERIGSSEWKRETMSPSSRLTKNDIGRRSRWANSRLDKARSRRLCT